MKGKVTFQQFFNEHLKLVEHQHPEKMGAIFNCLLADYSTQYRPKWEGLSISSADQKDKWIIINKLQTEIIEIGFEGDSFWHNLDRILDSNFIGSKHDLLVIKFEEKIIGYMLVRRDFCLEIISIDKGYRRRGFGYASLQSLKPYYILKDKLLQDPISFKELTIQSIIPQGIAFWVAMKEKIDWLSFPNGLKA